MISYEHSACKSPAALAVQRIESASSKYIPISFDITTKVVSAGIVIVLAIRYATLDLNKSTVISAALTPSILATTNEFILYTLSVAQVVIAVALVPTDCTSVLPKIDVTLTTFGAAIYIFLYPNTIAIAIALPVVTPPLPAEPTNPTDPTKPTDPVKPAPTEPVKPKDPAEPTKPTDPVNPAPVDPVYPA